MAGMRTAIEAGKMADFALNFFAMQEQGDIDPI
jgi:hypothetical protein